MNDEAYRLRYEQLRRSLDRKLAGLVRPGDPDELRDACRFVLSGGGKRIRGVIVLLSCGAVGSAPARAIHAAAAVEVLHNFTLVHDDVMDNSPLRRGRPTVHVRWNVNTAILTGDVLLGIAYRTLFAAQQRRAEDAALVFTSSLVDVCEGQALDLHFEQRGDVTLADYFGMIAKKTASLISGSAEIGAIMGGATARERSALRRYGVHLGRAFQLQDDLLDIAGNPRDVGKRTGGDIVERKRTYLLLRAYEKASGADRELLRGIMQSSDTTGSRRTGDESPAPDAAGQHRLIESVAAVYARTGVLEETREEIRRATARAVRSLSPLRAGRSRDMLAWLAHSLAGRQS